MTTATPSELTVPDTDAPRPPAGHTLPTWTWLLLPLAGLSFALLYPLYLVLRESVSPESGGHSLEVYRKIFGSHAFQEALWTTVWIALAATAGCVLLGFFLSLVLAFVPFPGSRLVARFIDIFLAFPSFLIALSLVFIYGSAGMANGLWTDLTGAREGPVDFLTTPWGVIIAEVTFFTPFVMRPLLAAFSQVDTSQLEVASSLGARPLRVIRTVILPEVLPSLAAGGALVLVLCLNDFGIVLFTGAKDVVTLPLLVYTRAILQYDYPGACVVAVVNVALSISLYGLYRVAVSRTAGGRHARS